MLYLTSKVSAGLYGFESPAAEYKELELSLDDYLIEKPSSTFLAVATGNSMEARGIFDGDVLVVDRSLKERTGDVIVCNLGGEFTCKVIDIENRLLHSDSDSFPPIRIEDYDVFTIEGVVKTSIRNHRPSRLFGNDS
ncbi:LexA family protein [Vibrio owensii]|uniref:LexA family protein n=1 Tax=Vibrio owensii TaxID=696485 RepID=UPI0018F17843|nr:S24 family peptidase [Vibrio owensii]